MTDFTSEQIKEIRRRICTTQPGSFDVSREAVLDRFPFPKVTRYRTFTRNSYSHRVRNGVVEYHSRHDGWAPNVLSATGDAKVESWAAYLARNGEWELLTKFADVCARPTEEVTDD